jgi:hypothetical protein
MTTPASVTIAGPASDDFTRSQQAVWASLPVSLTRAPAKARLAAVDGRSADWLETLQNAIQPGTAGVLVVRPAAGASEPDIRAIATAAADAGTIVAVQATWAANPAVAPFARAVSERLSDVALIDSVVQLGGTGTCSWADVLLDQLTLMRAVIGPLELARFAAQHEHGYTLDGAIGASTVAMSAVRSAALPQNARLAAYGATAEAHLIVPTVSTAIPATAWFVDSAGAVMQPTWYEAASRASWRRLHDAAAKRPGEPLPDLADLADDAGLLAAITADWRQMTTRPAAVGGRGHRLPPAGP